MAFNTAPGRAEYTASAAQTIFTFTFKIFETSDVKVYLTPVGQAYDDATDILIETTDYTVTINGDNGGDVTLTSGATLNDSITLVRALPIDRDIEYQHAGDLTAAALNEDQEYQTYLILDGSIVNERALTIPESAQGFDTNLPPAGADKMFIYSSDGKSIVLIDPSSTSFFKDAFIVNSMAALLGVDENVYGSVNVRGYHSQNDGGGDLFNWDSSIDKSTADGGFIIDPDQTLANQGSGVGNGCWVRQNKGDIDLRQYGAVAGVGNEAGNEAKIQKAIDKAKELNKKIVGDGDFYFVGFLKVEAVKSLDVSLVGVTSGVRPTKAELKATDESGRLALFLAYYTSQITFETEPSFKMNAKFTNALTYISSSVTIGGNLELINCAWHRGNIDTLPNASVIAEDLIITDALVQAIQATKGAVIDAPNSFLCNCHTGGKALNGGVLNITGTECYDTISMGFFIKNNGTIDISDGIIDTYTFAGLLNNYGGNFYAENVSIKNSSALAIIIESQGSCFAEGATFDNITNGVLAVSLSATIQARNAVFTNTSGYVLSVLNEGHIFGEGITVDGTNTGGSGGVYFNIVNGGSIQLDGFTGGLSTLDKFSCDPVFNQTGRGRAYIGDFVNKTDNDKEADVFIDDDTVYTIPFNLSVTAGMIYITTNYSGSVSAIVGFRAGSTPWVHAVGNYNNLLKLSTSVLTGTTGADGDVTFSAQDGQIQIENRSGFQLLFSIRIQQQTDLNVVL